MKPGIAITGLAIAGLLVATGCSSAEEDTQNANASACESLANMRSTVVEVTGSAASAAASGQTITVDETKAGLEKIKDSWEDVKESASDVSDAVTEQFDDAEDAYRKQLDGISGDQSLASGSAEVKSAQRTLFSQYESIVQELGC